MSEATRSNAPSAAPVPSASHETAPDAQAIAGTPKTASNAQDIARTPKPPYYAVIFTSLRTAGDRGYGSMSERMVELASGQPGFLGFESVRGADGVGITVSYWESEEAIRAWKTNAEHRVAQETGRCEWYTAYRVRVAKVERAYGIG